MYNLTKIRISTPVYEVFESFVDPLKIGNFWFSSSSERWESGKAITLKYEEYNATVDIRVIEIIENEKIVFKWGALEEEHIVTISLKEVDNNTIIEVTEEGFKEADEELISKMLDNKEGWVYMLTCLKGFLEFGVKELRSGLVK